MADQTPAPADDMTMVRLVHPAGPQSVGWNGVSYQPDEDGAVTVPAAAAEDLRSHGFVRPEDLPLASAEPPAADAARAMAVVVQDRDATIRDLDERLATAVARSLDKDTQIAAQAARIADLEQQLAAAAPPPPADDKAKSKG